MEKDKNIDKITLHYGDGTTEEINKGFLVSFAAGKEKDEMTATFHMVHISGHELSAVVYSVLKLGQELGLFDENKDENTEDD